MEFTLNSTNNENAKLTIDEHALTSLIKDLVGTQASTDSTKAMSALRNLVQSQANECKNVVSVKDLESATTNAQATTTQVVRDTVVKPVEPVATTEPEKEVVKECPTTTKDGADMEEIKKNIIMMELHKLKLQYGDSEPHKIIDMVVRYIENEYNMTKILVNLTKICYTQKEVYREVVKTLTPLMQIEYQRFNDIFVIVSDVEFYC